MRERLHHLAAVEAIHNGSGTEFARWADTRLDRWLVDWALRTGKEQTAKKIADVKSIEVRILQHDIFWLVASLSEIQTLVDIELFTDIRRIEDALSKHSCTEALTWCSENKTALRKIKVGGISESSFSYL